MYQDETESETFFSFVFFFFLFGAFFFQITSNILELRNRIFFPTIDIEYVSFPFFLLVFLK